MSAVLGIHHVTAISSDPQRTLDFYAGVLGLRFVKRTVNFDDPRTYHLYFADEVGTPGSVMTFFPWPGARAGRPGAGQVAVTSFAVPTASLGFWVQRLLAQGVAFEGPRARDGAAGAERVLAFRDFDGLLLEIVGSARAEQRPGWGGAGGIPPADALRGFHGVTLWERDADATERLLVDTLGFRPEGRDGEHRRFASGDGGPGTLVTVRAVGDFPIGAGGAGTVHHVAFRAADDDAQLELRARVIGAGLAPTPVIDRNYFHSVYFREPGTVLFELATDGPGFAIDEPVDALGERLMLPPQYEPRRAEIEAALPPIRVAGVDAFEGGGSERGEPGRGAPSPAEWPHVYEPADPAAGDGAGVTLLLLHGTGGDERDLVPLGRMLAPGAALLSPRGPVDENGMPRFFRRLREGVFDVDDLNARAGELADFVGRAAGRYGFDPRRVAAVGFSNGANIAVGLLLAHPGLLRAAVLLSPMLPYEPGPSPDLAGIPVFVGAGRADPIAPADQVERLAELLRAAGADVHVHWEPGGHAIARAELDAAREWLSYIQGSSALGP